MKAIIVNSREKAPLMIKKMVKAGNLRISKWRLEIGD
jgi:hypothetical protein